jgi:hypothetical protein
MLWLWSICQSSDVDGHELPVIVLQPLGGLLGKPFFRLSKPIRRRVALVMNALIKEGG